MRSVNRFGWLSVNAAPSDVFNVKDYGAVGDGVAMDTKALQGAIDACHANRGGMVRVPPGKYPIATIQLKSNVTLSLDYGATLLGGLKLSDYRTDLKPNREGEIRCLIYAEDASNITIEGLGTIDGRGTPDVFPRQVDGKRRPRPRMIRMMNCEKVKFSGVTYRNPASWGMHLVDCRDVHFDAITIRFRDNGPNNDGLDLDGCTDVLIENCDMNSGDDAVCLKSTKNPCRNFVVRNCRLASNTAPLKFGTSSRGGFINIHVYNCYFYDSPMGAIKLQSVDGGRLEEVTISRVVMENVGNPLFIRLGNRGRSYENFTGQKFSADAEHEGIPPGTLKNVRISDVTATVTGTDKSRSGPIMMTGIPGHSVENVVLENWTVSYPGGGTAEDAERVVPEDEARYPEQFFFGVLPSWGAYIRHAKNVEFENVKMSLRSEDARERIVLDDVEAFKDH